MFVKLFMFSLRWKVVSSEGMIVFLMHPLSQGVVVKTLSALREW